MLQAEIGSAKVTAAQSFPTRGHLMPDFTLSSSDGKQVSLDDHRGRSNLVLFFCRSGKRLYRQPSAQRLGQVLL